MEERKYFGVKEKLFSFLDTPIAKRLWEIMFSFAAGLLCAKGMVFGNYAPFGVAVVAAVPKSGMWASLAGSLFGYLLPSPVYMSIRYMAAVIAVAIIRWSLSELSKITSAPFYASILSLCPLLVTGFTVALVNNSLSATTAMYVAEAFLAAGCAYFFSRTAVLLTEKRKRGVFDNIDIACMAISFGVVTLSFTQVEIMGVSIGRVLLILLVLVCANNGGIAGGAIVGIASGVISGLSTAGLSYLSGAYGLGGLMAGVFSNLGKLATAIAFIVAHGVASLQIGEGVQVVNGTIEVAVATIMYMLIPKNEWITRVFSLKRDNLAGNSIRSNVILRLNHASLALSNVSNCVEEISQKLEKSFKPNINQVYNSAAGEICAACAMRALCWKNNKEATVKAFSGLNSVLRAKSKIESSDFGQEFLDTCSRSGEMREAVNKHYRNFVAQQFAALRAAQVRDIAGEQFLTTSTMLSDLSKEFSHYEQFDEDAAQKVAVILKKHGIFPMEICCRVDKMDRMTVEAEIERDINAKLNKSQFAREVSSACGRIFSLPSVSFADNTCKLQMCQRPELEVDTGMDQSSAGKLCGDSVIGFYDGQGNYIAIVSDGMGTGGMAAVDGTMASSMMESLIKAGLGYNTSLKMVNSALMAKSQNETLATVDIASIDLFTGKCEIRKAGATMSVIKKGKKVEKIEANSLPVGIMKEVEFKREKVNLKIGDMVVMLSDGVTSTGTDWILEMVADFCEDDPNLLARRIVSHAKGMRNDGKSDDISAFVIFVK